MARKNSQEFSTRRPTRSASRFWPRHPRVVARSPDRASGSDRRSPMRVQERRPSVADRGGVRRPPPQRKASPQRFSTRPSVVARSPDRASGSDRRSPSVCRSGDLRSRTVAGSGDHRHDKERPPPRQRETTATTKRDHRHDKERPPPQRFQFSTRRPTRSANRFWPRRGRARLARSSIAGKRLRGKCPAHEQLRPSSARQKSGA